MNRTIDQTKKKLKEERKEQKQKVGHLDASEGYGNDPRID